MRGSKVKPGKSQPSPFLVGHGQFPVLSNSTRRQTTQRNRRVATLCRSALWSRICPDSKMAAAKPKLFSQIVANDWVFSYELLRISWCSWLWALSDSTSEKPSTVVSLWQMSGVLWLQGRFYLSAVMLFPPLGALSFIDSVCCLVLGWTAKSL